MAPKSDRRVGCLFPAGRQKQARFRLRFSSHRFSTYTACLCAGADTKVVQRVAVRIRFEEDDRWPLLRAGLSAHVVIAHGDGDSAWAERAANQMAEVETQYNQKN